MSDLIGRSDPNYGEIAGKTYTRGKAASIIRNGYKKVTLESATGRKTQTGILLQGTALILLILMFLKL